MRRMAVLLLALGGFAVGADDPPGFTQLKPSDLKSIEQQSHDRQESLVQGQVAVLLGNLPAAGC